MNISKVSGSNAVRLRLYDLSVVMQLPHSRGSNRRAVAGQVCNEATVVATSAVVVVTTTVTIVMKLSARYEAVDMSWQVVVAGMTNQRMEATKA